MQNKILEMLIGSDGYVSGREISEKLGVSRQAVWKSINALKENGYVISSQKTKGYRLSSMPEYVNVESIKHHLKNKIIGKDTIVLDTVNSTNEYLKKLGNEGCDNGTVVVAREQTNGKGRLGRVWQGKKDDCLMFSILLRPKITPSEVAPVTPLAGLAVCKALRQFANIDCMIKWPNDVIVGRKKLAGILTEMSAEFDGVDYIVVGIGVNVGQAVFSEDIEFKATSLLLETGRHFNNNELLACLLQNIEKEFTENNLELSSVALGEYKEMCATIGRSVTFQRGTRRISGMAVGVATNGELKVMLSDGTICNVNSGEVTVQGIY